MAKKTTQTQADSATGAVAHETPRTERRPRVRNPIAVASAEVARLATRLGELSERETAVVTRLTNMREERERTESALAAARDALAKLLPGEPSIAGSGRADHFPEVDKC